MHLAFRSLGLLSLSLFAAACSTAPTGPSPVNHVAPGPLISQGPLSVLIPQGAPPIPPREINTAPVAALSGTKFVAFGDSLTYGTLSSFDGSFVYDVPGWSYPVRLNLALNTYHAPQTFTVINSGIPGEWAAQGATRIQSVLTAERPQGLLLMEGINDLSNLAGVSATVAAVGRMIDAARASNITVLVATLPQTYESCRPQNLGGECRDNAKDLVVQFNTQLRNFVATRQNVHIVDIYQSLGTDQRYIGADGLHPNEAGYERIATRFLSDIELRYSIRGSVQ